MPVDVRSVGNVATGTGTITPGLPAGTAANDILVMLIESTNTQATHTVTSSAGGTWSLLASQASSDSRLEVWWIRNNGSLTAPTVNDTGDHQIARMIAFTGCVTSGSPWHLSSMTVNNTAGISFTFPPLTPTVTNTMLIIALSTGRDANSTTEFDGWLVAFLPDQVTDPVMTEQMDNVTNSGGGGGFGMATGFYDDLYLIDFAIVELRTSTRPVLFSGMLFGPDSFTAFEGWGTAA